MKVATLKKEASLFSFLGSQLLDLNATFSVVPMMGIASEVNPLAQLLMANTSITSGILFAKLWALSWGWFIYRCNTRLSFWGLLGLSVFYFIALGIFYVMVTIR